jgi:hypothetical protein
MNHPGMIALWPGCGIIIVSPRPSAFAQDSRFTLTDPTDRTNPMHPIPDFDES